MIHTTKQSYITNFHLWLAEHGFHHESDMLSRSTGGQFATDYFFGQTTTSKGLIVCLHSTGCDRYTPFVHFYKSMLSEGYNILCCDIDGHGKDSTTPFDKDVLLKTETPHLLEDLFSQKAQIVIGQPVHLVGQSLGGSFVVDYLSRRGSSAETMGDSQRRYAAGNDEHAAASLETEEFSNKSSSATEGFSDTSSPATEGRVGDLPAKARPKTSSATLIGMPVTLDLKNVSVFKELLNVVSPSLWSNIETFGADGIIPALGKFRRRVFPIRVPKGDRYLTHIVGYINEINCHEKLNCLDIPTLNIIGDLDSVAQGQPPSPTPPRVKTISLPWETHYSILFSHRFFADIKTFLNSVGTP